MTTTAPSRSLELPPVALSGRPLRLDLPRFQLVPSARVAPAPAPAPLAAPVTSAAPVAPVPIPIPIPTVPALRQPAHPAPLAQSTSRVEPTSIAPITATPSLTRRDGTIGLAIGILVVTLVLAAAFAMQRSMHGWPPGMH